MRDVLSIDMVADSMLIKESEAHFGAFLPFSPLVGTEAWNEGEPLSSWSARAAI